MAIDSNHNHIDRVNSSLVQLCEQGSHYIGFVVAVISVIVLVGWIFDLEILKSIVPGLATMKVNTALLFLFSGSLLVRWSWPRQWRPIAALAVVIIAALTLTEYAFDWQLGIDEWLVPDVASRLAGSDTPGRMSVMTAVNFLLIGVSCLFMKRRGRYVLLGQALAATVSIFALLALVGYFYNVESLYKVSPYSSMALHTAAAFFALGIGILLKTTDYSFMKTSVSDTAGGLVIRWLLPLSTVVLLGLGWLRIQGQYAGAYDAEFGAAIFTVVSIVVLMVVIIWTGDYLHRLDLLRLQSEVQLQESHDDLEKRVEERTQELELANKDLEAFSYSISHDLRAPLRALSGFSRILMEDFESTLPEEANEHLQVIDQEAARMSKMIEELLTFSRLGKQPLNFVSVALGDVVQGVLAQLKSQQNGRQIEITVSDLPICWGDRTLLEHVMMNLLSNALKYTCKQEQAHIEVGYKQDEADNIYYVKDNGVGFSMRYAHKLFGVFQRLHSAQEFEGVGVGLSIVARIIHRHGGRIWAESEVGKGATFFFTLKRPDIKEIS